jgi:CDP-paratose 2-epimerase
MTPSDESEKRRPVVIYGGAGFIGTNLANRFLEDGVPVRIYDNLSRPGVEQNLEWLRDRYDGRLEFQLGDVRNADATRAAAANARAIFHFAAQVAVTSSLTDPLADFEVNARGTLNVLEAVRSLPRRVPVVFTSTNKVYGDLENLQLVNHGSRYQPIDEYTRRCGVDESTPLSFHSPYGCSKGSADQYVLDYARCYGISAVVFRMSCIYGLHQFGTEDQGWVAHFVRRALAGESIALYGDGMQVRDLLFADDLVDAFLLACRNIDSLSARAFNIGGGPANSVSLLEVLRYIGKMSCSLPDLHFHDWRVGDQKYYVSNTRSFQEATGWFPRVGVEDGMQRLWNWLSASEKPAHSVPRMTEERLEIRTH